MWPFKRRKTESNHETRASSRNWAYPDDGVALLSGLGTLQSTAGQYVTPETALQASAVLACVGRIARDLSTLPLHLLDAQGNRITDHAVARVLADPSPDHVQTTAWQAFLLNFLTWGYAAACIETMRDGTTPKHVVPLMSRDVTVERRAGELIYYVDGFSRPLRDEQVLHAPYLAWDGVAGQSPIRLARDVVGTSMALDEFAAKFFSNGGNIGTFFSLPKMGREALTETQAYIEREFSGKDNWHKPKGIAEATPHQMGVSPRESQAVEARRFQLREIARIFGMPVGVIDPEASTYGNLENQYRDYAQTTLRPIAVQIEQELERKLLRTDERSKLNIRWNLDAMIRASLSDRANADSTLLSAGVLTQNEAREHHQLPPVKGGDELLSPLNMAPAGKRSAPPPQPSDPHPEPDPRLEPLVRAVAESIATKESNAARRAAQKSQNFETWAQEWFAEHREHLKTRLPMVDEQSVGTMAERARDALTQSEDLEATLDAWPNSRPDQIVHLALAA